MTETTSCGWLLTDDLDVLAATSDLHCSIANLRSRSDGRSAVVTYANYELRFDGFFVEVGDDLPSYLGLLDAAVETGEGVLLATE